MGKPNIIYILADDMGYGDFGAFNNGLSQTPVLDQLITQSTSLTQHYSASPICSPSRAGFLTGRYPHRTGAIETRELRGLCNLAIRETTLADMFKTAGYATGLVGKWHNGCLQERFGPNARGFDEFTGFRSGWQDFYDWIMDRNGQHSKTDGRYLTDVFTEEAIDFVTRHQKEPFFLHLAYNAPHTPLQAPQEDIEPFAQTGKFNKAVSTIYGMIRRMDIGIGRLLETLDKLGLAENTIVCFTSDNGPQFGGQGENSTVRFNCNFNGAKGKVYEGGIRVPMIMRWPEGLKADHKIDHMIHACDWFPTLLSAAGIHPPSNLKLDGTNVLPVLQDESHKVPDQRFWQWNRYQPEVTSNAAMRDGDWKLVRPVIRETTWTDPEEQAEDSKFRDAPWEHFAPVEGPFPDRALPSPTQPELYNIADDPHEQNDLSDQHPDRAGKMLTQLETWFQDVEKDRESIGGAWAEG
ncbi:MAG: arylsulfatase [Candidatus Latescibacteria bacterium]|jgi:arylsulfatase A-like enzyme|nr:arylsulfatase [Candidatus Latescibacterota bacterium]MBT4138702.1 arylsulfatase [Candidatus Latescibacterota bacterium]MBT5829886.1 arylsulfatase [Candidatus Latescibacterota bacterium]